MKKEIKNDQLEKNLIKNMAFFEKRDVKTSVSDVVTPTDTSVLSKNLLEVIVHELSQIEVDPSNLPVRMSKREKSDIEEFIYTKLKSKGLNGKDISISRLLRYALRYMIRVNPDEFAEVLHNVFKKSNKLSI